jgi:hypothetical protein
MVHDGSVQQKVHGKGSVRLYNTRIMFSGFILAFPDSQVRRRLEPALSPAAGKTEADKTEAGDQRQG